MNILKIFVKQYIDFECPNCRFTAEVTLKEMWLEEKLICRGCKYYVQLSDKEGDVEKSVREINKSLSQLTKTLSKTITIKL